MNTLRPVAAAAFNFADGPLSVAGGGACFPKSDAICGTADGRGRTRFSSRAA